VIFGIGVDLCDIARIKNLYEKYGNKFARKILTDKEIVQLEQRAAPEQFLATRFAAKEAAVKALGTGFRDGIVFHSIEITNLASGKPQISFQNRAKEECEKRSIFSSHLSLSDEKNYVVAMVVLEVE